MAKNQAGLRLNVVAPCREDWDQMTGGDDIRFCGRCRQNVYDLSHMNEAQVRELVQGRACVRFFARADGTVVTSKCPPMLMAAWKRATAVVAFLVPLFIGFWGSVAWLRELIHGDRQQLTGLVQLPLRPAPVRPMMGAPMPSPQPSPPSERSEDPQTVPPKHHLMGKPVAHPRAVMGEPAPFVK